MKKSFIGDLPNYMASVLFESNDPLATNVIFWVLAYLVGFFAYVNSLMRREKNEDR